MLQAAAPTPSHARPFAPVAAGDPNTALVNALEHMEGIQWQRGCWAGEVKWSTIILCQYVIVGYLTGQRFDAAERARCLKHLRLQQMPDGAWGLHCESPGYVFATALGYVTMRLLGVEPGDLDARRALTWLRSHGGVLHIPSWGKVWLSMLGLYDWEGVNPVLPEMWLLPQWLPIHPSRMYCHTRLIYLATGYLYARRFTGELTPLILALRSELYDQPFAEIDFAAARHSVAPTDTYSSVPPPLRAVFDLFTRYESMASADLRRRALDECIARIEFELRSTNYVCASPVNGLLCVLAVWDRSHEHPDFLPAWRGVDYWRWDDADGGSRFSGVHSHTWDTALTVQAILDAPIATQMRLGRSLARAYRYLCESQIRHEVPDGERWHLDRRLGGWCYSDERHQWPVTDCTAEALSAVLRMTETTSLQQRMSEAMLAEAVRFILSRQNDDGGWSSYERSRAPSLVEMLNPAEMFGDCLVERSYLESTASSVAALHRFAERYPGTLTRDVQRAVARGVKWLLASQRRDGSWVGARGVSFIYALMHAVEALREAGLPSDHSAIRRACRWLLARQKSDGGWGEHYTGCERGQYVEHARSQVIMTSWALMALLRAEDSHWQSIERGVQLLVERQQPDGDFPEEAVAGVFFKTAMAHHSLYRNYYPIRALGRFQSAREARQPGPDW